MKVSRTMAYAVQAMLQLAMLDSEEPVSCSRLAKKGKMPERFLLQVLRNLVTHGLLHSTRGVEGGYYLARPLNKITLLDIFVAFDQTLVPSIAPLTGLPPATRQVLTNAMESGASAAERELARVSLADLVGEAKPKKGAKRSTPAKAAKKAPKKSATSKKAAKKRATKKSSAKQKGARR
jgi:Rrf2 family protein